MNSLVFLAWKVPRWQHIMIKYFTTDALASKLLKILMVFNLFTTSSILIFVDSNTIVFNFFFF